MNPYKFGEEEKKAAVAWLYSDEYRQTGRTTHILKFLLNRAAKYPGMAVTLEDHYKVINSQVLLPTLWKVFEQSSLVDGYTLSTTRSNKEFYLTKKEVHTSSVENICLEKTNISTPHKLFLKPTTFMSKSQLQDLKNSLERLNNIEVVIIPTEMELL